MNKRYLFLVLIFILSTFLYFSNAQTNLSKERQLALKKAELNIKELYNELNGAQYDLSFAAFRYAYIGYQSLKKQNRLNGKELFSIIDFTKDCNTKRFYTIDLEKMKVVYYTYVAHGKKSGDRLATSFSDVVESNKSSIGFYITGSTYNGGNGYSLTLHGDEKGYNSNLAKRSVVIHTADYADENYIARNGRMGRSLGCPVLPESIYKQVIDAIKDKTMIFAYYNDAKYLKSSKYLNVLKLIDEEGTQSVF
ncbi:murein L,D-transpeptidase catalytic domain family protein [Capnocytophaga sp. oral taxon 878]|uniref:murein L,D-transpeptidase catalytic domain family protein n=1 Tax=Capnocytophaga sp. oral taxon 878 TaxID=1316596 RepID=UPI000D03DF25|nr:murein L,D-transpeptidase catalytic domain family protein [Capnocytophaga sp. oral taxon 878]AVM49069.1 L,D-transpeptidase catalytic domain protein [Capnocytophaga sp. oral taxon 878]